MHVVEASHEVKKLQAQVKALRASLKHQEGLVQEREDHLSDLQTALHSVDARRGVARGEAASANEEVARMAARMEKTEARLRTMQRLLADRDEEAAALQQQLGDTRVRVYLFHLCVCM